MSIIDRFKRMISGRPSGAASRKSDQGTTSASDAREEAFRQSCLRRDRYWAGIGMVENDVLGHLVSPQFMGGSSWPTTRQAYRIIRRPDTLILATDGLSDPSANPGLSGNGFGMELFIATADIDPGHAGREGGVSGLSKSWAFELIGHVAAIVADAGGVVPQLEQYGVLSLEMPGVSQSNAINTQVPERHVSADDCLGVLLGVPVQDFPTRIEDMPLSPVCMVPVTLVSAGELAKMREGGAAARKAVVEARMGSGRAHLSSISRD